MINITVFAKNHFNSSRISDVNFQKFVYDHIQRLYANNKSGQYSTMIQATESLYNSFIGAISDEDIKYAIQQGKTKKVDDIIAELKKMISKKEGLVRATYGNDSPEYQTFFPSGLTEYSNMTKGTIDTLMHRLVNAFVLYQADLGTAVLAIFTDLQTRYMQARQEQVQQIGLVDAGKTVADSSRNALEIQMMKNLLTISLEYIGDTEKINDFFDQSIIEPNISNNDGYITGEIAINTIENIENQGITSNSVFKIENIGSVPLTFSLSSDKDVMDGANIEILPNKKMNLQAGLLGNANNTFFNVENKSNVEKGEWKVLIL